jgi:cobalamin synthase
MKDKMIALCKYVAIFTLLLNLLVVILALVTSWEAIFFLTVTLPATLICVVIWLVSSLFSNSSKDTFDSWRSKRLKELRYVTLLFLLYKFVFSKGDIFDATFEFAFSVGLVLLATACFIYFIKALDKVETRVLRQLNVFLWGLYLLVFYLNYTGKFTNIFLL